MGTHTTHKVASPVTHARGHAHIAGETPCWCPLARLGGPWKPLTPHHQYHFLPRPTDLLPLPPSATTLQAGPLSGFLFPASLWQIPVCPPPPDPSPSPPTPAGSFHTHPHLSQKHKGGCEVEERRGPAPEDGGEDFRGGEQAGEAERPCSQDQSHCGRKILQRAWQCRKGEGQDWGQGVPASHCYGDCGHLGWEGKRVKAGRGSGEPDQEGVSSELVKVSRMELRRGGKRRWGQGEAEEGGGSFGEGPGTEGGWTPRGGSPGSEYSQPPLNFRPSPAPPHCPLPVQALKKRC